MPDLDAAGEESPPEFSPTLWTLVLTAKDPASPERAEALNRLMRLYWQPLYYFVRRRGADADGAQDIVQGFFATLLERNFLKAVDRERGKFRTFLLVCMGRYLSDLRDREQAQKRGGGRAVLSLDFIRADRDPPKDEASIPPELAFERDWARTLLHRAIRELRRAYEREGRGGLFEGIRGFVVGGSDDEGGYAAAAAALKTTAGAVRTAVHRARRLFREMVRREVRHTVESDDQVDGEIDELLRVMS